MPRVSWPPTIGEPLPRASEAHGIREKLAAYCLDLEHEVGGAKARGFAQILGIGIADIAYLVQALHTGVREAPVTDVRDNAPYGMLCEVRIPVRGLGNRAARVELVTTSWELRDPDASPRLVTAYIDG
jgi:Domain of unknown function (DUF6883)